MRGLEVQGLGLIAFRVWGREVANLLDLGAIVPVVGCGWRRAP